VAFVRNFPLVQIDHARYWRGSPHTWSTRYFISGSTPTTEDASTLAEQLVGMESEVFYPGPSASAGFLNVKVYPTGTGPALYEYTYGVIETPSTWVAYTGTKWTSITAQQEGAFEPALSVVIPLTGLSTKGKPVTARKYYHAIPISYGAGDSSAPDVSSSNVTLLESGLALLNNGSLVGGRRVISNGGRLPSSNPTVQPYYTNHQAPRGRKKKAASSGATASSLEAIIADAAHLATLASLALDL
jgi:hypothetical protein